MQLPDSFLRLPAHRKLADAILQALKQDERVAGIYLSGSFAYGQPDKYSDLDFYILVSPEEREQIKQDHSGLRSQVGDIISDFPGIHLGDSQQFIVFYRDTYPIHVDYQYRVKDDLSVCKKDAGILILLDRAGELQTWREKCRQSSETYSPSQAELQFHEDRFWAWCIYTDSKIKRGELWEARTATEYMRNRILVPLAFMRDSILNEGTRRLENKFSKETLAGLEATLPSEHSKPAYSRALHAIAKYYLKLMDETTARFNLRLQVKDRDYFRTYIENY